MNNNINSQPQQPTLARAAFSKEKMQPFGSHFLIKLEDANYKLACNLSAKPGPITTDWLTDSEVIGK